MVNSINTNIAAFFAQANINRASNAASASVARLSSGNRITKASDDVAALSTGTSLQTSVTTLRSALLNASQGTSLLQIADGALAQVSEILQRQKAIALQAGSGSLSNTDRGFLNQEFQALSSEIDRISGSTNFNGVKLVNGSLSTAAAVAGNSNQASAGTSSLTFRDAILAGETVKINGVLLTASATVSSQTDNSNANFLVGSSLEETVANLAAKLNLLATTPQYSSATVDGTLTGTAISAALGQAIFSARGNPFTADPNSSPTATLTIASRSGGSLSNNFRLDLSGTATVGAEAVTDGGFGNVSSFNLFTTGSAANFTSATSAVSAASADQAAGTPFQDGDIIKATAPNGSLLSLYTIAASASLTDIVNGINATSSTSGIRAALVYTASSTSYNIRLSYNGAHQNLVVSVGAAFDGTSSTYALNGTAITQASAETAGHVFEAAATAATSRAAIFFKESQALLTSALGAAITAVTTNTTTTGTADATTPFVVGESIRATVNGVSHILHTFVAADGLDDIVTSINAKSGVTGISAIITGSTGAYNIRLFGSDPDAAITALDTGNGAAIAEAAVSLTAGTLTQVNKVGLRGGSDNGLGLGSTRVSGTVGDTLLTALNTERPKLSLTFSGFSDSSLATDLLNQTVTVGGVLFSFNTSGNSADQILIGSTLAETLDNAVSTINSYLTGGTAIGDAAYQLSQLRISRDGDKLVFEGKSRSTITNISGTTSTISKSTPSVGTITSTGSLAATSTTYGIDASGIRNAAFAGTIGGFTATYNSSNNTVDLAVSVGGYTYTARGVDPVRTASTTVRLFSDTLADGTSGGYFDIQLAANEVTNAFGSQSDANAYAIRLNAAVSSLTFTQQRAISSYSGTQNIVSAGTLIGSLVGTKVSAQLPSFTGVNITGVSVAAPSGSNINAGLTLTIGGVNYTASALGSQLGANQTYRLVSQDDAQYFVDFTTGSSAIDLSSADNASAVQSALLAAFGATGANGSSAALSFQVGTTASDSLSVSIGDVGTDALFAGVALTVATQADSTIASNALDIALGAVTAQRAGVGALQSRFNFASANIENSIQNQDAARAVLLDTDIASESTNFATAQVKLQAGISVLAQANQQLQALLKLIG